MIEYKPGNQGKAIIENFLRYFTPLFGLSFCFVMNYIISNAGEMQITYVTSQKVCGREETHLWV